MSSIKVGNLELDESEYRSYLIMTEAIKEQVGVRIGDLEVELHGKDGNNGLQSKIARLSGAAKVTGTLVAAIILYIIGCVIGS